MLRWYTSGTDNGDGPRRRGLFLRTAMLLMAPVTLHACGAMGAFAVGGGLSRNWPLWSMTVGGGGQDVAATIKRLIAREFFDSRGNPPIEVHGQ